MNNTIKTIFLLGLLSVFLILIGGALGGRGGLQTAFLFALLINGVSYFFSDKIALSMNRAKKTSQKEAPELHQIVKSLSFKAGIPMPDIYITPAQQANAFATGRNPKHSSVAVTQGLLSSLQREEIKAVLAHEIGHIKNRDVLIASIAAVLASSISFLSRMGLYGGFSGGNNTSKRNRNALGLILAVFGPIAAMLVQFAISRQREFEADNYGAELVGSGSPLAEALLKIHKSSRQMPIGNINPAFSSLYISNPLGGLGGLTKLFSTHPPLAERIERLQKI